MSQGSLIINELVQVTLNYIQVACQLLLKSYWLSRRNLEVTFYRSILWFLGQISLFPSSFYHHPCHLCYSSCLFCPVSQHLSLIISDLSSVSPRSGCIILTYYISFWFNEIWKLLNIWDIILKSIILVSCGCHDKLPQASWLSRCHKTGAIYILWFSLIVTCKAKVWNQHHRALIFLESPGQHVLLITHLLVAAGIPWSAATLLQPLPRSSHCFLI